jgi:hypothetical protein
VSLGGIFKSTVTTVYKADTTDAKRKTRELRGEQRKAAKEQLSELERQNARIDKQIALIGKIGLAVGAAAGAWRLASGALNTYLERSDLRMAAHGVNIDRLQGSMKGLVSETETLRIAAALQNTEFELSQEQMEMAGRAIVSLKNQGNDLQVVITEVTKALVEGNSEGLRKFGIQARGAAGTAEGFEAALAGLQRQADSTFADMDSQADEVRRSQLELKDAIDRLAESFGGLVAEMAPAISALAEFLGLATALGEGIGGGTALDSARKMAEIQAAGGPAAWARQQVGATIAGERSSQLLRDAQGMPIYDQSGLDAAIARATSGVGAGGGGRTGDRPWIHGSGEVTGIDAGGQLGGARGFGISGTALPTMARAAEMRIALDEQIRAAGIEPGSSPLDTMFGPADEFLSRTEMISSAFGMLEDAGSAAFKAWIDGSKSMGEAFRDAIAQSTAALASEAFVQALRHTAYAIGSLAIGGPLAGATAAQHGKAAAAWGGVALTAGLVARELGGNPTTSGASAGAAAGSSVGAGGGGSGGGGTVNVFLASGYEEDDPRKTAIRVRRAVDRGQRLAGGRNAASRGKN